MRLITVLAFIGLPALIPAQHVPVINPSRGMIAPSNAYRYGNILFPGGISQQVPAPHLNTHAGRLGGVVSGSIPYTGVPPGQDGRFGGRTVVVPYAYPVFYGGGYGYGGYYGQEPQAPNVTVVVPQQPVPQVVINNSYVPDTAKPVLREYSPGELPESNVRVYEGPSKPAHRKRCDFRRLHHGPEAYHLSGRAEGWDHTPSNRILGEGRRIPLRDAEFSHESRFDRYGRPGTIG